MGDLKLENLPTDYISRIKLMDELADAQPLMMRRWVERHPRNLMVYEGWCVEPFHQAGLQDMLTQRRTFWLAPRGSGKSTAALMMACWLAIAEPEHMDPIIGNLFPSAPHPIGPKNIRIALTGNSAENAQILHQQARFTLLDPRLEKLFGSLEGKRWKDHTSTTSLREMNLKEGTFTALGLGSKVAGGHYDVVLADDWVTLDNSRTELQRRRLAEFYQFTVKPAHEPWARTIGAGTRYHPQDWYADIKKWADGGADDWHLRLTPALTTPDGVAEVDGDDLVSFWPQVFPVETLQSIRKEIGSLAFSTQFQNDVTQLLGEFFQNSWMEHFAKWDDLPGAKRAAARTVVMLDPAIKAGKRNDYSAFVVLSYVAPYFYVRNVVRGQWTQNEIVQRCVYLNRLYRPQSFGVEVVGGLEFLVQELMRTPGMGRVSAMRPTQTRGKDKVGRASDVRKFFEQQRVFLEEPTEHNGIGRLIHEMLAFPTASNVPGMDDCVDALVWALLMLTRSRTRLIRSRRGRR